MEIAFGVLVMAALLTGFFTRFNTILLRISPFTLAALGRTPYLGPWRGETYAAAVERAKDMQLRIRRAQKIDGSE